METEKWLQERTGKFTASEIYKLLVRGRKKDVFFGDTAMDYIEEIATQLLVPIEKIPSIEHTKAIVWGNEHEQEANEAYATRTMFDGDVTYYGKNNPVFFPYEPYKDFAGGSPDAIQGKYIIEYKCPYNPKVHLQNLQLDALTLPTKRKEYYAQMQFNMLCTGLEQARFVSYDPRFSDPAKRLAIIDIYKDDSYCQELIDTLDAAVQKLKEIINKLN